MALGDDAARQAGRDRADRLDHGGIERHHRHRSGIIRQHAGGALRQPPVAVEVTLEFEHQSGAAAHQIAQFAQGEDAIGARLEADFFDVGRVHIGKPGAALGQAAERIVMMHHGLAIGADLQIGFHAVAAGDGGGKGGRRVLNRDGVMQAAMGQRPCGEPDKAGHLAYFALRMILSENRFPSPIGVEDMLFGIMRR